jgi:hypothetical protein
MKTAKVIRAEVKVTVCVEKVIFYLVLLAHAFRHFG